MPRPKLDETSKMIRIHMLAPLAWTARVDQYAKEHGMNRSEAARALINMGLMMRVPKDAEELEATYQALEQPAFRSARPQPRRNAKRKEKRRAAKAGEAAK
jgi:hypothetical protein